MRHGKKNLKKIMKEFMLFSIPVYGLLRRIKINKEIEKSYLENTKKIIIRLKDVNYLSL